MVRKATNSIGVARRQVAAMKAGRLLVMDLVGRAAYRSLYNPLVESGTFAHEAREHSTRT